MELILYGFVVVVDRDMADLDHFILAMPYNLVSVKSLLICSHSVERHDV